MAGKTGNLQWTPKQLQALNGLMNGMPQADIRKTYGVGQSLITKVSNALKAGKIPSNVMPATVPSPSATPPGGNTPAAAPAAHPAAVKSSSAGGVPTKTSNIQDASRVIFKPQIYEMEALPIIWQAMEAAINVWGWPREMTPEQFLKAFLLLAFWQRGIALGSYTVFRKPESTAPSPQEQESQQGGEPHAS